MAHLCLQHFSETPGFCEVGTTTVIIWEAATPRGTLEVSISQHPFLSKAGELPRKAQRKGFGSIGWELFGLEVY